MVALPITRIQTVILSTLIVRVLAATKRWKRDYSHLLVLIDWLQGLSKCCRKKYSEENFSL